MITSYKMLKFMAGWWFGTMGMSSSLTHIFRGTAQPPGIGQHFRPKAANQSTYQQDKQLLLLYTRKQI
jgi:hypothetical protein